MRLNLALTQADYDSLMNNTTVVHDGLKISQILSSYEVVPHVNEVEALSQADRATVIVEIFSITYQKMVNIATTQSILSLKILLGISGLNIIGQIVVLQPGRELPKQARTPKIPKGQAQNFALSKLSPSKSFTAKFLKLSDGTALIPDVTLTSDVDGNANLLFTIPTTVTDAKMNFKTVHTVVAKADVTPNLDTDIIAESASIVVLV